MKISQIFAWIIYPCLLDTVASIKCYTCDVEKNITCPGWDRSLVDSVTDLGDSNGLLTSCVSIVVGGGGRAGGRGSLVQQTIMPGDTHCTKIFIESWELLLNAKWNQDVRVSCCKEDGCNNEENTFKNSSSPSLVQISISLIMFLLVFISLL